MEIEFITTELFGNIPYIENSEYVGKYTEFEEEDAAENTDGIILWIPYYVFKKQNIFGITNLLNNFQEMYQKAKNEIVSDGNVVNTFMREIINERGFDIEVLDILGKAKFKNRLELCYVYISYEMITSDPETGMEQKDLACSLIFSVDDNKHLDEFIAVRFDRYNELISLAFEGGLLSLEGVE